MADEAQFETRPICQVLGIETVPPAHATQPTIFLIKCETATGPLVVRLSQIAGTELAAEPNRHPLTRGFA
jgi:hypothetical protein